MKPSSFCDLCRQSWQLLIWIPPLLRLSCFPLFDLMNKNVSYEKKELMLTSHPTLILTTFSSLVLARRGRPDELRGQRFLFLFSCLL